MWKFMLACAAFGALALTALRSSPAHAEEVTDPVTGITIDLGPNVVQHGENAPIYVVSNFDCNPCYPSGWPRRGGNFPVAAYQW